MNCYNIERGLWWRTSGLCAWYQSINILINIWDDDGKVLSNGKLQELAERCGMTETKLDESQEARIGRIKSQK